MQMTEIIDTILPVIGMQQKEDRERDERYNTLAILDRAEGYDTTNENLSRLHITSGGIASSTSVTHDAWYHATPDTASNLSPLLLDEENLSGQTPFSSGLMIKNSCVVVSDNELYYDTSVNEGGMFYISSGGTAVRTTVNGFGDEFDPAGGMHVFNGGTANDTTVGGNLAFLHISSGGVANRVAINYDGSVIVSSGGIVNETQVKLGGWLHVSSGGVINGVTVSSSFTRDGLYISSGGTATGRIIIEERASATVFRGTVMDFDVSGLEPGAEARINNITRISDWWDATYTLTVSDSQAEGTYTLAGYAEDFNIPLMVQGITGNPLGTLPVGGVLLTENCRYSLTLDQDNVLTMTKNNRSGAFDSEVIADGLPLGIGSGQYTRNVIGGTSVETSGDPAGISRNTSLVIDGGEFSRNLFCGDRVLSGSLIRTGNISTTINGGTFSGYVAGGLCFNQKSNIAKATLKGNVCTTITGGTFQEKGIYGGCIAVDQNSSAQTMIEGNVSLVFRPDDAGTISIQGHVYAGSYRFGKITGDVSVVFSGAGTVNIGGEIWGGCSGDYYEIGEGGNRTFVSSICENSDRLLSFTGFTGNLTCQKIRGFKSIEFVKDNGVATHAALSGSGYNLSDIRNWKFEYGCDVQDGDFANEFTGDTLTLTGLPDQEDFTEWTLLTNHRDGAFRGFGDGLTVYLGSQKMDWDAEHGCFSEGNYRLALAQSVSSACLILSKLPS